MKLSELFEGGTLETQKKKRITFYCICVTLALIAVMLTVLIMSGIISAISNAHDDASQQSSPQVSIGETIAATFEPDGIYSGSLLLLNGTYRYKGTPETVVIRSAEGRAKTSTGGNVYSIISSGSDASVDFRGTKEAVDALNLMMRDFYAEKSDDNLCIKKAYSLSGKDTVDPVFSSAEAFSLFYYFEYPGVTKSIYGVDKYSWIYNNAHKYGFINVTSSQDNSAEEGSSGSDIFRYVGVPHATYMKTKKLSFEGYLEQIKTATPENPILVKSGRVTYASYYISKDDQPMVPAEYEYTVSGNNTDGYIVTVSVPVKSTVTK